jgi:hypothetical protein
VIWHHRFHFRKANALDSYPRDDLLIAEREEEFPDDFRFGLSTDFIQNDDRAQQQRYPGCNDKGEQNL